MLLWTCIQDKLEKVNDIMYDDIPKYIYIKNQIYKLINEGRIKPGNKIPTENELAVEYNASRHTVRKALNIIEQEGLLYKVQGVGTFVKKAESKPTKNIGFISISLHDYIFVDILHGADNTLHNRGYQIILGNSKDDPLREKDILEEMIRKDVDGLIIEPAKSAYNYPNIPILKRFVEKHLPVVILDSKFDIDDFHYVTVDDVKGGYLATRYFIDNDHERIAMINKMLHKPSVERLKGYEKALEEAEIPVYKNYIKEYYTSEFQDSNKYVAELKNITEDLMALDNPPTGIFCFNDQIAVRVREILEDMGYSVPGDVSIIGYDDSKLVSLKNIGITSVAHPKEKAGEKAANIVLDNINNLSNNLKENVVFTPRIIERNSVKKFN